MDKDVQDKESRPILFETDDFDMDSFNVKPLSKGLGFHQEKERRTHRINRSQPTQTRNLEARSVNSRPTTLNETTKASQQFWDQTVSQSELSRFYQDSATASIFPTTDKKTEEDKATGPQKVRLEASMLKRAGAWICDVCFVIVMCSLLVSVFYVISGMEMTMLLNGVYLGYFEMALFGAGLFSLIYIFYFTILDLAATPGKALFSLKLLPTSKERMSVTQTFVRSLVSLISFLILGLPAILDFQSKLSDSNVYLDND